MKPQVVIVDDDPALLDLVAKFVAGFGCTPVPLATGEEAWAAAMAAPPALVIADISLPGISGLEVCRRLKASPATRGIPVLLVTASAAEARAAAAQVGVDAVLGKPFERGELRSAVRQLLGSESRARGVVLTETVLKQVWARAGGRCECKQEGHGHEYRCGSEVRWDLHGARGSGGWQARLREPPVRGAAAPENVEIVCWPGCQAAELCGGD